VQPFRRAELRGLLEALRDDRPLSEVQPVAAAQSDALPRFAGARVLVADDSAVNREVALEALARLGVAADTVDDGRQALEAATDRTYDLVLMDGSMPEMDGFESSRAIREEEARSGRARTPIVALTAHVVGSAADAWRGAGMDGVLYKPFTLAQLAEVLGRFLKPTDLGVPLPEIAAETAVLAAPLSNELFDSRTRAELAAMSGSGAFLAKVEGLYRANAPTSAAAMAQAVRAADADALARAAHALKSMSFNIGAARVAELCGRLETSARSGALDADLALETAQALHATLQALTPGGAPAQVAAPATDPMLAALKAAIEADALEVVYQAQYDRTGTDVVGAEALVRWTGGNGPVSPGVFIPLAEQNGLIPALTDRVLSRMLREAIDLSIPIAFNASALEVSRPDFADRIRAHLDASGFPARRLEIEITETAVLERASRST
jgi:CheY-like chemotaxis protein